MPILRSILCLVSLATLIVAGDALAKKKKTIAEPVLEYSGEACFDALDLSLAQNAKDNPKALKKMMKNRTIKMVREIDAYSPCLNVADETSTPYAIFEIPTGITGRVIYAGAKVEERRTFAANISILNGTGETTRSFPREKFKIQGTQYGVTFKPRDGEKYILFTVDPSLVGLSRDTIETSTTLQTIVVPYPGGASSGTNSVGKQKTFSRKYSYAGDVAVRMVFPKQEKKTD